MEEKTTGMMAAAPQNNLQRVSRNIENWMAVMREQTLTHKHESKLTIRDTLRGMSINEMIRVGGAKRSDVMLIIDLQLTRFLKSINVSVPLTDYQRKELVMTLADKYPHETLNDFLLCFKMARQGYFGPVYNRIDITVISEYMTKYLEMKAYERENEEKQVMKDFKLDSEKQQFKSMDEFVAWKEKWYADKMTLREKLNAIETRHDQMKKRGAMAVTGDDPKKEADYQQWKNDWLKTNGTKDDETGREPMERNVDPGSDQNVSIPNGTGGGNNDAVHGAGS